MGPQRNGVPQLALMLALLMGASSARASDTDSEERQLHLAGEYRYHVPFPGQAQRTTHELSLPHGIVAPSEDCALIARIGMALPNSDTFVFTMPLGFSLQYDPLPGRFSPYIAAEFGGYLIGDTSAKEQVLNNRVGVQWVWSTRGLLGLRVHLWGPLELRTYGDISWVQQPLSRLARETVFSGWGAGSSLGLTFPVPDIRAVEMVSDGEGMPEGW